MTCFISAGPLDCVTCLPVYLSRANKKGKSAHVRASIFDPPTKFQSLHPLSLTPPPPPPPQGAYKISELIIGIK